MYSHRTLRVVTAAMTLAVLTASTLVPVAEAGHGRGRGEGRRWKNRDHDRVRVVERVYVQPRRHAEYRRHSSNGSTLAGFLGGIAVGVLLSKATQASTHPAYRYEDPYCQERFASLDACGAHMRGCDHPRVARKIQVSTGRCVDTYRWQSGGWMEDDGWQDRGYQDRDYDDGNYDDGYHDDYQYEE